MSVFKYANAQIGEIASFLSNDKEDDEVSIADGKHIAKLQLSQISDLDKYYVQRIYSNDKNILMQAFVKKQVVRQNEFKGKLRTCGSRGSFYRLYSIDEIVPCERKNVMNKLFPKEIEFIKAKSSGDTEYYYCDNCFIRFNGEKTSPDFELFVSFSKTANCDPDAIKNKICSNFFSGKTYEFSVYQLKMGLCEAKIVTDNFFKDQALFDFTSNYGIIYMLMDKKG